MRKMEHIMEPIVVWLENIVSERITDKDAIPLQITLPAFSLCDFHLKVLRKTFLVRKGAIECWQIQRIGFEEPLARFSMFR